MTAEVADKPPRKSTGNGSVDRLLEHIEKGHLDKYLARIQSALWEREGALGRVQGEVTIGPVTEPAPPVEVRRVPSRKRKAVATIGGPSPTVAVNPSDLVVTTVGTFSRRKNIGNKYTDEKGVVWRVTGMGAHKIRLTEEGQGSSTEPQVVFRHYSWAVTHAVVIAE